MRVVLLFLSIPVFAQVWDISALDWSPAGVHMLLVSEGRLYVGLAPEGRELRPLYPSFSLEWARFGGVDWFVFSSATPQGHGLYRGSLSKEEPFLLYTAAVPLRWPTVSWDGTRVAWVENWDRLVILNLETGSTRTVLGGAWPKATPEFTPDGEGLIFAGFLPQEGGASWDLFYFDLRGEDLIQLTVDPFFDWCPRISPDGLWVAFVSNRGGAPDIWVLSLGDGELFPLTQDPWEDAFPVWSPEGSRVGYVSCRPQGCLFLSTEAY